MSVSLVGSEADIFALVADSYGDGYISISPVANTGLLLAQFHGEVTIVLDPQAALSGRVLAQAWLGAKLAGGIGAVNWNGTWTQAFGLPTFGSFELPYDQFGGQGLLGPGASASLHMWSPLGDYGRIDLKHVGGLVHVTQDIR